MNICTVRDPSDIANLQTVLDGGDKVSIVMMAVEDGSEYRVDWKDRENNDYPAKLKITSYALLGDIDHDGDIDLKDFVNFSQNWADIACGACGGADLDGNNNVDMNDLRLFVSNWLPEL